MFRFGVFFCAFFLTRNAVVMSEWNTFKYEKRPSILLALNSRNEAHILPTFFGYIELLNYPKDRISIWIQSDHNNDDTCHVLNEWSSNVRNLYHNIIIKCEELPKSYADEHSPNQWTISRYLKILELKQKALEEARRQWADYILFVDGDNLLMNAETLNILIDQKETLVSPMLRLFDKKSGYSNFWGAMDDSGYYKRVDKYFEILYREQVGAFHVPMVHSTVLLNLRSNLTDNIQLHPIPESYSGEVDDIMVFAYSAKRAGIPLAICNVVSFGYMLPHCADSMTLEERQILFTDVFIDHVAYHESLVRTPHIVIKPPSPMKVFDETFVINLKRRPDRLLRVATALQELGIVYKYFEAVDGKKITAEQVKDMGIVALEGFKDPFLERPLTLGEIGCFLSHWYIWNEIVERKLETTLVLEDDVRFQYDFRRKLTNMMKETEELGKDEKQKFDLLYLGRKHMSHDDETFVGKSEQIVWAKYSYWTLSYVITLSGAKKLLAGNPFPKLVPVDEYIPIMFDEHPEQALKEQFYPRDLIAFSADPLLIYPTHYVGDKGYISDTENTLSHEGKDVRHFRLKKKVSVGDDDDIPVPHSIEL